MGAFGDAGQAEKILPVFSIGVVKGVENFRDSKKASEGSPYQVIDVVIEPLFAPANRDYKFYLSFDPAWLRSDLDEETTQNFMYRKVVAQKGKTSVLEGLLGEEGFASLVEAISSEGKATGEQLFTFLQENALGNVVGFVVSQQREKEEVVDPETGETANTYFRTDRTQVERFFTPSEVAGLERAAAKENATVRVAWEEGSDPFGG